MFGLKFEVAVLILVLAASFLSFGQFYWDKLCAKRGWRRIPERTLLLVALFVGVFGAKLGQRAFRHKTYKQPFRTQLNLILVVVVIALPVLLIAPLREMIVTALR